MERSIRIGKDFNVRWSIHRVMDGERQPYELAGKELVLQYRTPYGLKEATEWKVVGNTIVWTFRGKEQKALGSYELILTENGGKDGMVTVDTCRAFKLVAHSCEETEGSGSDIVIEDVVLESEVTFAALRGPQGERGPEGPQGPQGERGPQGEQGPAGPSYDDTEIKGKLAELSEEITSQLFEKGNVSYGNEVANDAVYRSLYIPCKKGDVINGKIYRVKVYDANYQYLAEEGVTLNGALADHVVETANCAYVRIVILTRDKNDCAIYINGVNALYLIEKSTLENHRSIRESLKQTNSNLEIKAELPCVFEVTDKLYTKMAVFGIKDMSIKAQEGWLYTIVLKNLSTSSQFSLYRAEPSAPRTLKYCGNFCPTLTSQRSGVEHYVATFSTGEKAEAIVDWDAIKGLDASAMYPDEYILKEEVFKGGLLSNNLIPQVSEIECKVDALEDKVDALSVGGGAPKEKYWAVCGDSITNANHATIYDIAEGDDYMPIDGYPNLSTYKRKNYAYYIAQRNGLKWANYGWGGTTLSSVSSKAYGYKNAFVDDRMRQLANYEWDYISIFFGGNDSYFGPTHHKDKWLKETYGVEIGYPINESQIGAEGFANAEQKAACDAVTGEVHGVQYNDNAEYFLAKFIGAINSTETDTWYGALNTCVSYLLSKYGKAKIILIASYTPWSTKYADAVVAVAKKYGVRYYDFRDALQWPTSTSANTKTQYLPNVAAADEKWVREDGVKVNANVFYRQVAQYLYDGAHPTNIGYEEMSYILEDVIMG